MLVHTLALQDLQRLTAGITTTPGEQVLLNSGCFRQIVVNAKFTKKTTSSSMSASACGFYVNV